MGLSPTTEGDPSLHHPELDSVAHRVDDPADLLPIVRRDAAVDDPDIERVRAAMSEQRGDHHAQRLSVIVVGGEGNVHAGIRITIVTTRPTKSMTASQCHSC